MWVPFVKATQLVISAESFFNWALSLVPILLQYWKYPDQTSTFFVFLSYHVLILLPNIFCGWINPTCNHNGWGISLVDIHHTFFIQLVSRLQLVDPHILAAESITGTSIGWQGVPTLVSVLEPFFGAWSHSPTLHLFILAQCYARKHPPISQGVPTWFCKLYRYFFSTNQDTSSLHQIKPSPCISCIPIYWTNQGWVERSPMTVDHSPWPPAGQHNGKAHWRGVPDHDGIPCGSASKWA